MMFRSHVALGVLISLMFVQFISVPYSYLFVPLVGVLSGLPDIDTEKSKFGRKIWPLSLVLRMVFGHRGIFHSLFAALGFFGVFWYFKLNFLALVVLIAYLAHLIGDALTREGVAFLYPFSKRRIAGFMKCGGMIESFVFVFIVVIDVLFSLNWIHII